MQSTATSPRNPTVLLYGIMSLSARFSTSPYFKDIHAHNEVQRLLKRRNPFIIQRTGRLEGQLPH